MSRKVDIAVFPVAGFGTRFLPATKASPKEMLPIVDKPLIQFAVEEAIAAGIKKLVFISGKGKRTIEDHFDSSYKLRAVLEEQGKNDLLRHLDIVPKDVTCIYIRQDYTLGLGAAVLHARPIVEDRPFVLLLPDDFIINQETHCVQRLIEIWEKHQASTLAVLPVSDAEVSSYGIVGGEAFDGGDIIDVKHIVEKPDPSETSDRLGIIGRYVLDAEVFDYLDKTPAGVGGELQLTDALKAMMAKKRILAYEYDGLRYDCGSKIGYVRATCDHALNHPDLKDDFVRHIKARLNELK